MISKFLKKNIKKISGIALVAVSVFTFINLFNSNNVSFAQEVEACSFLVCSDPTAENADEVTTDITQTDITNPDTGLPYNPNACKYWNCSIAGAANEREFYVYSPEDVSCEWNECNDPNAVNYGDTTSDSSAVGCRYLVCTDSNAVNYDPALTTTDPEEVGCLYSEGCTDSEAFNYDSSVSQDDGSCRYFLCTNIYAEDYEDTNHYTTDPELKGTSCHFNKCDDPVASNYNVLTTIESERGQCTYLGCTNFDAYNYDAVANQDNGSCAFYKCDTSGAINYQTSTTTNSGLYDTLCQWYTCDGEENVLASNYRSETVVASSQPANNCIFAEGCTDELANNYDPDAVVDDASCTYDVLGCTDNLANNYNANANTDDGTCRYDGCIYADAINYDPYADDYDDSCEWYACSGAGNESAVNFEDPNDTVVGGTEAPDLCIFSGCTDALANNYNANANFDDGSCTYDVWGCMDDTANNYNASATVDDGSCTYDAPPISGCTDSNYVEYNPSASIDDGSCVTPI